ncbi:MAG: hypothetical protein ACREBP_06550, partial [Sphingomicrobium sp.]
MVPKRSAMAPANGWPIPQRMFCIANANPNTSRPQSLACDIGVRKKPSVARGPKLIMEMRQPHSTITAGVRQPIAEAFEGSEMAIFANRSRDSDKPQLADRSGIQRQARQLGSRAIAISMTGTSGRCLYGVAP